MRSYRAISDPECQLVGIAQQMRCSTDIWLSVDMEIKSSRSDAPVDTPTKQMLYPRPPHVFILSDPFGGKTYSFSTATISVGIRRLVGDPSSTHVLLGGTF
jgi:hypothetical protein